MNKANAWSAHAEGRSGGKKCAQLAELIWRWHLSAPRDPAADGVDADDNVGGDLERRARQFLKWDISSGSCGCCWKPFDEGEKLLLRCRCCCYDSCWVSRKDASGAAAAAATSTARTIFSYLFCLLLWFRFWDVDALDIGAKLATASSHVVCLSLVVVAVPSVVRWRSQLICGFVANQVQSVISFPVSRVFVILPLNQLATPSSPSPFPPYSRLISSVLFAVQPLGSVPASLSN